jgi:lipopolysaccharide heptosyltransferase I
MHDYPKIIDKQPEKRGNPRVLIVRLSAIGDCVQTMPLACAVRDHWPGSHVTWVVEKASAPLVEACDAVDRVIVLPKRFATSWRLLVKLRSVLANSKFDFALDPQGLTKSGLVSWLSPAKRRIGFARPASREFNPWLQTELVNSAAEHRVHRYLELLRPLGIERPAPRFGIVVPAAQQATAEKFDERYAFRDGYAVLNPGAGWDSKLWPLDRFAEVARHLFSRGVPSVVVWAGEKERPWAEKIVSCSRGTAFMAPPTSLLELAAILQNARLFVGSDTGPLHLASAMGGRCVALFGASCGNACGPFGPGHIVLQAALDESAGRKRPGADNWAMREIATDAVCNACDAILGSGGPSQAIAAAA